MTNSKSSQRLKIIPLGKIFLVSVAVQIIAIPEIIIVYPKIDVFSFIVYSIPGTITLVWSITYIFALIFGYGLTNTPTYPKAVTLKGMELVKPQYSNRIEKLFLFLMCVILVAICLLSYSLAIFA